MNRKSKFKGVCYVKKTGMYKAQITKDGKSVYLGSFRKDVEAAKVYNFWALKYFKDEAVLNDLEEERRLQFLINKIENKL